MKVEIKVPSMGESISEATVANIIKASGSQVATDDEILELETDKVNQVIYAPQAGAINLSVQPNEKVKIGQVIGFIDTDASSASTQTSQKETPPPPKVEKPTPLTPPPAQPKPASIPPRYGKDEFLQELQEQPVPPKQEPTPTQETKTPPQEPKPSSPNDHQETRQKMSNIRKVIASRLLEVKNTTAMLTTFNEVDMSHIIALRDKYKESFLQKYGVKLGFMSFFVKASLSALEHFPALNSYIQGDDIVHREYFNIGIAVGTDKGLLVPVIRDSNKLSYAEIEIAIEKFAKKAREGFITVDDLQGGSFTITNGGIYGSMLSTPIMNPNQSAILGLHKITKRPVVIDDQITIRPIMYLALSYDHRIVDGKEAVSFLVHIKNNIEFPDASLLGL